MTIRAYRIPIQLFLLSSLLCLACGPFLLLPGGELSGTTTPAPEDWDFTQEISTVEIETRPEDPYSVNIWATGVGDVIYLHAGTKRANWVEHIEADPRVRLRVADRIFELRGVRVEDPAEFERFANAYDLKYGLRPRNENVREVYLIRLEAP